MGSKFTTFLDSMRSSDNDDLINAIQLGYNAIYEVLSTDDANGKQMSITAPHESPASIVDYTPNSHNEYFDKTLPNHILNIVNKSYTGQRVATYPQAGRTILDKDPLKNNQTSTYGANNIGGNYYGYSGGYNLGGPP